MMFCNTDPTQFKNYEEIRELNTHRTLFCSGFFVSIFDNQNCTSLQFQNRLKSLAYIWTGEKQD